MSWGASIFAEVVEFLLGMPWWFWVVVVLSVVYVLVREFAKGFTR